MSDDYETKRATGRWVSEAPPYDPETGELWVMPGGWLKAPDGNRWQQDGKHWVQIEHRNYHPKDKRRLTTDEMLEWAAKGSER